MNELLGKTRSRRIRISIFSNYNLVRDSIKSLIEVNRDMEVVELFDAEVLNRPEFMFPATDVAVVYLEDGESTLFLAEMQRRLPETRIVIIINGADLDNQIAALKCGVAGVVRKEQNFRFLLETIRQTAIGEVRFNQDLLGRILNPKTKSTQKVSIANCQNSGFEMLTKREIEVIRMVGEGFKNKVIADRLAISEATVRHHLSSIYGKVGVEDRLNLVILAYQKGLIQINETGTRA
jgi:DNA-binding NarL/FixJ family response regulator